MQGNDYQIILVHGCGGWVRDELSTRFGAVSLTCRKS